MRKTDSENPRPDADAEGAAEVIPLRPAPTREIGPEPDADESMAALSRLLDEAWSC